MWKGTVKTPSYKDWCADGIEMRQAALSADEHMN